MRKCERGIDGIEIVVGGFRAQAHIEPKHRREDVIEPEP